MFFELRYEKYLCCTFGLGSLANKDAIAERTERKHLVYAVSAPGRLRGKSGEGEFISLLNIAETFVLGTSVLMYTGTINSCLGSG